MGKSTATLAVLGVVGCLCLSVQSQESATITVASWNIQQFGKTKSSDPLRLARIALVIAQFDVVAIQEITDAASQGVMVMNRLTEHLQAAYNRSYEYVLGPRTGCAGGRTEQYAVLYDPEKIELVAQATFPDSPNVAHNMCRDPLVVWLETKHEDVGCGFDFALIVAHTDPDAGALERDLRALRRIYESVQAADTENDDVILLGDLNASPPWRTTLGTLPDVSYVVAGQSTMVWGTNLNDNIVFQQIPTGEDFTGIGGVFDLISFLGISPLVADRLSDHLPVFAKFYTCRDTK